LIARLIDFSLWYGPYEIPSGPLAQLAGVIGARAFCDLYAIFHHNVFGKFGHGCKLALPVLDVSHVKSAAQKKSTQ